MPIPLYEVRESESERGRNWEFNDKNALHSVRGALTLYSTTSSLENSIRFSILNQTQNLKSSSERVKIERKAKSRRRRRQRPTCLYSDKQSVATWPQVDKHFSSNSLHFLPSSPHSPSALTSHSSIISLYVNDFPDRLHTRMRDTEVNKKPVKLMLNATQRSKLMHRGIGVF